MYYTCHYIDLKRNSHILHIQRTEQKRGFIKYKYCVYAKAQQSCNFFLFSTTKKFMRKRSFKLDTCPNKAFSPIFWISSHRHLHSTHMCVITTFVLVLLLNIQHATIDRVYSQTHCILFTLPTHANKACSTIHIHHCTCLMHGNNCYKLIIIIQISY